MIDGRDAVFAFHLAPRVLYGEGAAREVGAELARLGVRRPLVVTDRGVMQAGACAPVLESLADRGLRPALFEDVTTNPTDAQADAAAEAFARAGADGIIGVGGGSAMDVAKAAAVLVSSGGPVHAYEDGRRAPAEAYPPLVLVPTTAGTGSEAVAGAMITDTARRFKMHLVAVPANVALCDPLLTASLPPPVTAATGLDALTHAIGAFASVEAQPLADAMALYAIEVIRAWLPRAIADGGNREARAQMMVGSLAAGVSMKGGGTAEHAFAHAVNTLFGVHHGVGCAVFLADVMAFNLPSRPARYARIAQALGVERRGRDDLEVARDGVEAARAMVRDAGIPTLRDLGIGADDVPRVIEYVVQDRFHLGLNPRPVGPDDAERLAWTTLRA